MDFTDAYHLSTPSSPASAYGFSPGSTFLLTINSGLAQTSSLVQVRYSETLQIVRTWKVPFGAVAASWSEDGANVLVSSKDQFVVLKLDSKELTEAQDDVNVIAKIRPGYEGLALASWCGRGLVATFSLDGVGAIFST